VKDTSPSHPGEAAKFPAPFIRLSMYFIYSLLLGLGFLVLLPKFLLDAWQHGKYISGLGERLGLLEKLDNNGHPVVWLHCVSVGEVQAARPLFQALRREFPAYAIAVSTVTVTGQQLARDIFKNEAHIFYFPVDWRWTVRRALKAVNPSLVLIMETELWPSFLRECRRQTVPVAVVNGRLSEQSFRRYKLVRPFIARVVRCLDLALMQTKPDADRLCSLGLPADRVVVSGNMKFDAGTLTKTNTLTEELAARFHFADGRPVLLAASTHDPEERIILEAFNRLRLSSDLKSLRLIIAPRHPERFDTVASLLAGSSLSWTRRSDQAAANDNRADAVLLDSIGELRSLFPLASLVFMGGSLAPIGGHNILEPAAAGGCIVTGAHTKNFDEIVKTFVAEGAIVQIGPVGDAQAAEVLAGVFENLLRDPQRRQDLETHGKALVEENRGATERTIQMLHGMLTNAARPEST
jgi:3-deoxy-D-manno-octulosonic-acid transferase